MKTLFINRAFLKKPMGALVPTQRQFKFLLKYITQTQNLQIVYKIPTDHCNRIIKLQSEETAWSLHT